MCYTECPTHYRTRHFFNNFTTSEDIGTKFEVDLPHCVRNVTTFLIQRTYSCFNTFIGVRIIKEMPGSVASETPVLGEEHRLKVLDSRLLRKIREVTCLWVELRNEERRDYTYTILAAKYYMLNQIKKAVVVGARGTCGRKDTCVRRYGGSKEKKTPLGGPSY